MPKVTIGFDLDERLAQQLEQLSKSYVGLSKNQLARKVITDFLNAGELEQAASQISSLTEHIEKVLTEHPALIRREVKEVVAKIHDAVDDDANDRDQRIEAIANQVSEFTLQSGARTRAMESQLVSLTASVQLLAKAVSSIKIAIES